MSLSTLPWPYSFSELLSIHLRILNVRTSNLADKHQKPQETRPGCIWWTRAFDFSSHLLLTFLVALAYELVPHLCLLHISRCGWITNAIPCVVIQYFWTRLPQLCSSTTHKGCARTHMVHAFQLASFKVSSRYMTSPYTWSWLFYWSSVHSRLPESYIPWNNVVCHVSRLTVRCIPYLFV